MVNATEAWKLLHAPGFVAMANRLNIDGLRLPGGTFGNTFGNDPGTIGPLATLAGSGAVLWVANPHDPIGSADYVLALQRAGVHIMGVEVGNELYLTRYAMRPADYLKRLAIASYLPEGMPIGAVVAPSAAMRKGPPRLQAWNDTVLAAHARYDAVVLHAYMDPGDTPARYCAALRDHLTALHERSGRPVWVTEYGVGIDLAGADYPQSAAHVAAVAAIRDTLRDHPAVTIGAVHRLAGPMPAHNLIHVARTGANLTPLGTLFT